MALRNYTGNHVADGLDEDMDNKLDSIPVYPPCFECLRESNPKNTTKELYEGRLLTFEWCDDHVPESDK